VQTKHDTARASIEQTYRARTARSAKLHEAALALFPGGVTRSVTFHAPYPVYVAEGCNCRVTDVDGNVYLDHLNNFGSMIHGHAHPAIVAAIREQAGHGTDFGSPIELHLALARAISARLPSVERVRFTTSGTEAVLYAVRAARAFTGRPKILKMEGSYHGGYDSVSVSVDPGPRAPEWPAGKLGSRGLVPGAESHTLVAPFNDAVRTAEIIHAHRDELAAVIVEPLTVRGMIPAEADFLRTLRDVTREAGVLLVLDEVVTFRLAYGGAQERFGITPDLTTLGKVIGGGLPVGALGGRADIMAGFDPTHPDPVHHSGTFAGNAVVMAAGLATLELLDQLALDRLDASGARLRAGLGAALGGAGVAAQVTGLGSLAGIHLTPNPVRDYRSSLAANRDVMRWLHLALLNHGIFARSGGGFFLSTAVADAEIDATVAGFVEALGDVASLLG
jgi:glutamate-1-semialdehyde 2,1-aminomutase